MAIFKKRGKWWIGYRVNGQRRREPTGATSHALAKEILAKRLNEASERKHFPGRVANASAFLMVADKFWSLHGRYMLSKSWSCMIKQVKAALGAKRISDIGPADIQRYYNETAARTSNSTANRHLTLIKSIFNKAKAWGDFYGDNPCGMVKKQREAAHRLRYLSGEEIKALLAVAHPRLYPVLVCALLTGMRQGEILGLTWENVSLDRDILYVLKTKSGRPREIPIVGKLREALISLGPKQSGPVFEVPLIMVRRYFEKALKDAGIFGFRFHDLRHTFASHFVMRTNDLPALQNILGHSSPLMTQRYAHLSRGHLAANMAAFESAMPVNPQLPALTGHQRGHHPLLLGYQSLEKV